MEQLQAESSILEFHVPGPMHGDAPEVYCVLFHGAGLWRPAIGEPVRRRELHEVVIRLGNAYPRTMPELQWKTPIFHPNISASGVVCLGGYSTHWAPSLRLDDLCAMLWDMIRYANYDVASPYNREAALWVREQTGFALPVDPRPIRDRLSAADLGDGEICDAEPIELPPPHSHRPFAAAPLHQPVWSNPISPPAASHSRPAATPAAIPVAEILFVDEEVIEAEVIELAPDRHVRSRSSTSPAAPAPEILFLE